MHRKNEQEPKKKPRIAEQKKSALDHRFWHAFFKQNHGFFADRELAALAGTTRALDNFLKKETWHLKLKDDFNCSMTFINKLMALSTSHCKEVHRRLRHLQVNFYPLFQELQHIGFDFLPLYADICPPGTTPYLRNYFLVRAATYGNYKLIQHELSRPEMVFSRAVIQAIFCGLVEFGDKAFIRAFDILVRVRFNEELVLGRSEFIAAHESSNQAVAKYFTLKINDLREPPYQATHQAYNSSYRTWAFPAADLIKRRLSLALERAHLTDIEKMVEEIETLVKPHEPGLDVIVYCRQALCTGNQAIVDLILSRYGESLALAIRRDQSKQANVAAAAAASGSYDFIERNAALYNHTHTQLSLLAAAATGDRIYYDKIKLLCQKAMPKLSHKEARFYIKLGLQRGHYDLVKEAIGEIILPKQAGVVVDPEILLQVIAAVQEVICYYFAYQQIDKMKKLIENCRRDFKPLFPKKISFFLTLDDESFILQSTAGRSRLQPAHVEGSFLLWYFFEATTEHEALGVATQVEDVSVVILRLNTTAHIFTADDSLLLYYLEFLYRLIQAPSKERRRLLNKDLLEAIFVRAGVFGQGHGLDILQYMHNKKMIDRKRLIKAFMRIFEKSNHEDCEHVAVFDDLMREVSPNKNEFYSILEKWPDHYAVQVLNLMDKNSLVAWINDKALYAAGKRRSLVVMKLLLSVLPAEQVPVRNILAAAIKANNLKLVKYVLTKFKIVPTVNDVKAVLLSSRTLNHQKSARDIKYKILLLLFKEMAAAKKPFTGEHLNKILSELRRGPKRRVIRHLDYLLRAMLCYFPQELRIQINQETLALSKYFNKSVQDFVTDYLLRPKAYEKSSDEWPQDSDDDDSTNELYSQEDSEFADSEQGEHEAAGEPAVDDMMARFTSLSSMSGSMSSSSSSPTSASSSSPSSREALEVKEDESVEAYLTPLSSSPRAAFFSSSSSSSASSSSLSGVAMADEGQEEMLDDDEIREGARRLLSLSCPSNGSQ